MILLLRLKISDAVSCNKNREISLRGYLQNKLIINTYELPATKLIETADKSTLTVLLIMPSIDSRIITTDALAIMQDNITMATGSRRVRPESRDMCFDTRLMFYSCPVSKCVVTSHKIHRKLIDTLNSNICNAWV